MKASVAVIGSGFAGLSVASVLASKNIDVTVYEKNDTIGGRARAFREKDFMFDMGPSWYWMPDVFEKFYKQFGYTTSDFYELKKLNPGFKVIFGDDDEMCVPENFESLCDIFESIEKGSGSKLKKFIEQGEYKYKTSMNSLVYLPSYSFTEYISPKLLADVSKLTIFSSFSKYVRSYFKNPKLISLLEFPVLFLGAMPKKTPALYSLMNYSGLKQGTWYPMGGFAEVANAFKKIAEKNGVKIKTASAVSEINVQNRLASSLTVNGEKHTFTAFAGAADYAHIENKLLPASAKSYSEKYWNSRTFAPSSLIFYLGINKKIPKLEHHNLFFDKNFETHSEDIYVNKKWPDDPLFYVCCPSKTDSSVAPINSENLFILIPISIGLNDEESVRNIFFEKIITRLEKYLGEKIRNHIVVNRSYCVSDFINDYNAYKGNAYGLANTLMQTAFLKPKIRSKKVKNLFYAGQLTVPGPGVPPSIISGQISANEILKYLKNN